MVYHLQQLGNQVGKADISVNLALAFLSSSSAYLGYTPQLLANLARSYALVFQGFQLHLVGEGQLTGADGFPLQIVFHHLEDRLVVVQLPGDDRQGFQARQLGCVLPPVA